ncbi:hypothetical protein SDC9_129168 [bioreactor metagenome]|uniref:Uncharacterized protein n=1 Tax=bioreactor metagenome TaxID=1076179 RepID=A0A645CY30_9ZZZZ
MRSLHHVLYFFPGHVDRRGRAKLSGQAQPVIVYIGDDDMARARVAAYGCRHDADGARARDQDILPDQVKHQGCMGRVAQRVKKGDDLLIEIFTDRDAVGRGNAQVLGKSAVPVDAHALCVLAPLRVARAAVAAYTANDVALARYTLAHLQLLDGRAEFGDLADILVPDSHRSFNGLLRPFVPVINVEVRAAYRCLLYLYQNIVGPRLRNVDFAHPQADTRFFFDKSKHFSLHLRHSFKLFSSFIHVTV